MNTAKDSDLETPADESLCLELSVDSVSHTFELKADETRAIAVGSLLGADLRIDRPGVAPLHFHIEREEDAVWIVPAYAAGDLRVNTARIAGPKQISGRAVIEFADVRIDARILEPNSAVMRRSSVSPDDWADSSPSEHSAAFEHRGKKATAVVDSIPPAGGLPTVGIEHFVVPALINTEQPTGRMPPISALSATPVQRTVVIQPMRVIPLPAQEEGETTPTTLREGQELREAPARATPVKTAGDLPGQDTIEMAPFWMTEMEPEYPGCPGPVNREPAQKIASKSDAMSPNSAPLELPAVAETSLSQGPIETAVTTYFEPVRVPTMASSAAADAGTLSTTEFDVPYIRPHVPDARGWLARLGLLSKQRPLLVWLAGTGSVFALSASIAIGSRHFQHAAKSQASHPTRQAASASPPGRPPATVVASPPTVSLNNPEPIVVVSVATAASTTTPKKGQPNDPELVGAVGHVIAGRYGDAQKAYTLLSARLPTDPSFAVVSRLLAKKGDPRCSGSAPNTSVSCPEVKQ